MCTVTFVKSGDKVVITSNRDEQANRQAAAPRHQTINGKNILFPKDPLAGGTWFATDENGNILVLLNGASEKHQRLRAYRKSRGLIVLDLISANSPRLEWESIDLDHIEPFTLVLFEREQLFQLRWNGMAKEHLTLDATKDQLWSSATLYPAEIRAERASWFFSFMADHPNADENALFHFHRNAHRENRENGLVIERGSLLRTVSITQAIRVAGIVEMRHHDLLAESSFTQSFPLI